MHFLRVSLPFLILLNTFIRSHVGRDGEKSLTERNLSIALSMATNFDKVLDIPSTTILDETRGSSEKIKNQAKIVLREDPFFVWKYKSRWENLGDLKMDTGLMMKAIQPGDLSRLRKVLNKALNGRPLNLLIIGGSNSAGGRLEEDENNLDGVYFKVFADWWEKTIGEATGAYLTTYNEAIGGTGSYFFAYCYKTFIRKDVDIDFVFIEASINYNMVGKAEPLEQLTRQVLAHSSRPAVFYVNLVSGLGLNPYTKNTFNPTCLNLEDLGQSRLSKHYGITSFSLKEILCCKRNGKWQIALKNMASSDGRHIGIMAHAQVGMMLIEYVRGVFKDILGDFDDAKSFDQLERPNEIENASLDLPQLVFVKRHGETLKHPLCWTGITPNIFQNLHKPTLQLRIITNKGFSRFHDQRLRSKNGGNKLATLDMRTDGQGGWYAWNKFSRLKMRVFLPRTDSSVTRSVTILTRTSGTGAKAQIWLDGEKEKAIFVDSKSIFGKNQLDTIACEVSPGFHIVTVKTIRKGMFLVSGVLVGPSDFFRRRVV